MVQAQREESKRSLHGVVGMGLCVGMQNGIFWDIAGTFWGTKSLQAILLFGTKISTHPYIPNSSCRIGLQLTSKLSCSSCCRGTSWKIYAIYLSIHPYIHPSIHPSSYLFVYLSIYLPIYLSICLSICLSMYVCMYVCMYMHVVIFHVSLLAL